LILDDQIIPPKSLLGSYVYKKCETKGFEIKRWAIIGTTSIMLFTDAGMETLTNSIPLLSNGILVCKETATSIKIVIIYREYSLRFETEDECSAWLEIIDTTMVNRNFEFYKYAQSVWDLKCKVIHYPGIS
jgi:hypothetical protein